MYDITLYSAGDCSQGLLLDEIFIQHDGELPSEEAMSEYISQYIESYESAMHRCRDIISYLKRLYDNYDDVIKYYNIYKEFRDV